MNFVSFCSQYIIRDPMKSISGKEKSAYILVPKRSDQQISDKAILVAAYGTEIIGEESGRLIISL